MINPNAKIIAVDFDGTIVEDAYPKIGKPMPFAFEALKKLSAEGHRIILWTYRYGKELRDAVDFCESNGLEFYAVNKSFPEEEFDRRKMSRKINADVFVDDRNFGGLKGWGEVYQEISQGKELSKKKTQQRSKNKWSKFFK
ncbi:MAG: hydrolase [Cryomorphaceae bacterium]|nr:hydrolase [Cryomorphaceae bacterium]